MRRFAPLVSLVAALAVWALLSGAYRFSDIEDRGLDFGVTWTADGDSATVTWNGTWYDEVGAHVTLSVNPSVPWSETLADSVILAESETFKQRPSGSLRMGSVYAAGDTFILTGKFFDRDSVVVYTATETIVLDDGYSYETWAWVPDRASGLNSAAATAGYTWSDTSYFDRVIRCAKGQHYYATVNHAAPTNNGFSDYYVGTRAVGENLCGGSSQKYGWIYFNVSQIPNNVTLTHANLIVTVRDQNANPDTMFAIVDTVHAQIATADTVAATGGGWGRNVTWNSLNSGGEAVDWSMWSGAADTMAWFSRWEQCGTRGRGINVSDGGVAADQVLNLDVRDGLQAMLDLGRTNRFGGFLVGATAASASNLTLRVGTNSQGNAKQPMLVARMRKGDHTQPWDGKPLAFQFQTDDWDTCNLNYAPIFEARGYRYALNGMFKGITGYGGRPASPSKLTRAQLCDLTGRGFTPTQHSRNHLTTWGVPEAGTADSMHIEIGRAWIDSLRCYPDSSYFKTLAWPNGGITMRSIRAAVAHNYLGARAAGGGEEWLRPNAGQDGAVKWAGQDAGWGTYLSWYEPTNLYAVSVVAHTSFVGTGNTSVAARYIRNKVNYYAAIMARNGNAALVTFAHDQKGANGETLYNSQGINEDELGYLLDAVTQSGLFTVYDSFDELVEYYRAYHNAVPPEDSFAHTYYDSMYTDVGDPLFGQVWWRP